jgi:hypothetical protein
MAAFYYTWTTPVGFVSWFLAVVAVMLGHQKGILPLVFGAISLTLMLITYQGALSIFATVFVASCISMLVVAALTKTESDSVSISKFLATGAKMFFIVLFAGLVYYIQARILSGGIKAGNSEMISLNNIVVLWPQVIRAAFNHLVITQPDILNPIKTILLIVVVSAVLASFFSCRKKFLSIVALIILWPILICAVKAVYFIAKPEFSIYEYRANLGMAFMYGFCFFIILISINQIKILRVLYAILAFFVVTRFVQANLVRQSVLMYGQMHDLALANRILTRIESLPNIEDGKVYNFIRIGSYPWYRWTKLSPSWINGPNESGEAHMDTGFIPDKYTSHSVFQLLGSMVKLKFNDYQSGYKGESYARENLLKGRKPYPHESSVFLVGDTIYVYLKDHPNF